MLVALYIFLGIVVVLVAFYKFVFLRDNKNQVPAGDNLISPASGKIVSIQTVDKNSEIKIRKGFFGKIETKLEADEEYCLINIFMSPLDVHIQKMPLAGKILSIEKKAGKFSPVFSVEAGLINEKQEFLIESKIGLIKVIQIAGFLARRCRSNVVVGDELEKGQRMGIILLGSQVALLFPKKNYRLEVKEGDRVSSGETIITKL